MRRTLLVSGCIWLLVFFVVGCGDESFEDLDSAESALNAASDSSRDSAGNADRDSAGTSDRDPARDTGDDSASDVPNACVVGALDPTLSDPAADATSLRADDANVRLRERIEVDLHVRTDGQYVMVGVRFHNPYRCHWKGDLFVEREAPDGSVHHIARRYGMEIRGGSTVGGTITLRRPNSLGTHVFSARAFQWNGGDEERWMNCELRSVDAVVSTACPASAEIVDGDLVVAHEVVDAQIDDEPSRVDDSELRPCDENVRPPIHSDLTLRTYPEHVDVMTEWQNRTREYWRGDLYIDVVTPDRYVKVLRRDRAISMAPGIGFCTLDQHRRPTGPGVYLVTSRAMRREGGADQRWVNPGGTEINAVCNGELCELIEPEQRRAGIVLTGRSVIHLESDFFSEFTRVELAYRGGRFDITDRCRIRQYASGDKNHVEVHFDTMNLPIGPRTWGRYTVELHPMPVISSGAKVRDRLWIFTNGGE